MKKLKRDIPHILCKLEKIFPPAFFEVMVHLVVHLPNETLLRGSVQYEWMYPIERRLGTLKNFLRNRAMPKGSTEEAYLESETLAFWERFMDDDVKTRYNRDDCWRKNVAMRSTHSTPDNEQNEIGDLLGFNTGLVNSKNPMACQSI